MQELNVTPLIESINYHQPVVGSVATLGEYAASNTWNQAQKAANDNLESFQFDEQEARDHFRAYGAWEDDEIKSWTKKEILAMIIQEVESPFWEHGYTSGDYASLDKTEQAEVEESGRVFFADNGEVYLVLGE